MAFLIAIEGTVTVSILVDFSGNPASAAHWPRAGAAFKGSFEYHPGPMAIPGLLTNIYVDFGSFSVLRETANPVGTINLLNSNQGIQYTDGFSTGFTNVSLPAASWQLNEFQLNFDNRPDVAPHVNPAAINFNLFDERTMLINGANGNPHPTTLVFRLTCRIDCLITLPLGKPAVKG
jgi:hypothetical protein